MKKPGTWGFSLIVSSPSARSAETGGKEGRNPREPGSDRSNPGSDSKNNSTAAINECKASGIAITSCTVSKEAVGPVIYIPCSSKNDIGYFVNEQYPSEDLIMANAAVSRGSFQWIIFNPFLPWRNLEATFYLGSPTVSQWKVTLQPINRRINYWKFSFSLEFDEWFYQTPVKDVVVDKLLVVIRLNGKLNTRKDVSRYHFQEENRFMYNFQSIAIISPQMEPHRLEVKIEISLPGRAIRNEIGNGLFYDDNDLRWLSKDMEKLLDNKLYPNMNLLSRNDNEPIRVHSYIIDARWDNFFKLHDFAVQIRDTVQTNISRAVLLDILTYMYTGSIRRNWPDWKNAAYSVELFQVIDRYKLYHLYKVFAKIDLQQRRVTRNPVFIQSRLFPLYIVNNRPINNASYRWHVNPNPEYKFNVEIRLLKDNKTGPWLSYSLQSKSPSRVCAELNLEVMKRKGGNPLEKVSHFHGRDFTIDPDETVESRNVLFLGCPETFGGFDSASPDGTEIEYFIRCLLNVINGNTVIQVLSERSDRLQSELIRFGALSDHLYKFRRVRVDTDMDILCSLETPGYFIAHHIHKGIIAARLPGLENVILANDIPDSVRLTLSIITLPIILDYMYTGKIFAIPIPYLDEINDFAEKSMFHSLLDLINRIRSLWIDR
ncbi:unnamed protein product [Larinioides sclopetarius]|uniref:Uncharacterized protein n=1 Tax=Larinioides sclopetarius TaxID=280406 RepID=A0AAV1YSM8_9ARAC